MAKNNSQAHEKVLVFESVTDGGFAKTLRLEEGATLELGRYDHTVQPTLEEKKPEAGPSAPVAETPEESTAPDAAARKSKRFTSFHFRKRTTQQRSVAGPALAVVDAEANAHAEEEGHSSEAAKDASEHGVKAIIRLTALDLQGKPLHCVNEQTTYLHIVRFGAAPAAEDQDKRPWVVKVVKREATVCIGSYS